MIPVCEPWIGEEERTMLLDAFDSGWISSAGKYLDEFEKGLAAYCERQHGIAVSSGTTALETAFRALDLPPGSEVIMPTFTIIACATAVINNDLVPVLVDADPHTWGMDVNQIESKINERTGAILVVHIYGHPVDMDPVLSLAEKNSLRIVEDAAEVHGAKYKGRICGSFGDASIFSFYANKIITTGEGGMIVCDDEKIAEKARSFRNQCFRSDRRFYHTELGRNFRFTNLQAALGVAQLKKLPKALELKAWLGSLYREHLKDVADLQLPAETDWGTNVYWMYGVVVGDSYPFDAAELALRLQERGVQTRPFFLGMHEQPVLQEFIKSSGERFPVAERLAKRGLYLPSGLTITEEQVVHSAGMLKESLKEM